jgi:hypothetical protein
LDAPQHWCGARLPSRARYPIRTATPGAINPAVTQGNVASTIRQPGWTRTVRPPEAFTSALQRRQLRSWWS